MASMFSWYNQQYASWNRMSRLHAPTFFARTDTRTSRTATAMYNGNEPTTGSGAAAGDVVINMSDISTQSADKKDGLKDTLFGPSVGVATNSPDWCAEFKRGDGGYDEKNGTDDEIDELTPDVVKEWIRRSKDPSEPTTTLQALVNLKRPTIRLSPLAAHSDSEEQSNHPHHPNSHQQQHGLEFEFDCDAPRCSISVYVVGVPAHLGEENERDITENSNPSADSDCLHIYETSMEGGFAQRLTLADGAILELAKLEAAGKAYREERDRAKAVANASTSVINKNGLEGVKGSALASISAAGPAENTDSQNDRLHENHRRRLTFFKKRGHSSSQGHGSGSRSTTAGTGVSGNNGARTPAPATVGPALAVVDAEASIPTSGSNLSQQNQNALATFFAGGDAERARRKKQEEESGVRVAILLSARDEDGRVLRVRNEQVTYLHVVRQGAFPAASRSGAASSHVAEDASSSSSSGSSEVVARPKDQDHATTKRESEDQEKERDKEDTRPWVVHVVKREARIGLHTFQLHEIYGLTSHSTATPSTSDQAQTSSSPVSNSTSHTYPPPTTGGTTLVGHGSSNDDEDAASECLLCLSSPREVVLLPCRHLVACRECAVNMVEFGAGGNVTQSEGSGSSNGNSNGSGGGDSSTGDGMNGNAGGTENNAANMMTIAPTTTARRKRKAKGWFCPVCRQPYTSLLRITTTPPPLQKGFNGMGSDAAGTTGLATVADAKRVSVTSSLEPEHVEHPLADGDGTTGDASATNTEATGAAVDGGTGTATRGTIAKMLSVLGSGNLTSVGNGAGAGSAETPASNPNQMRDLERGL